MSKKLTSQEYINKCIETHGKVYDYSSLVYIDSKHKITIRCHIHGAFQQWPSDHRRGFGCPQCSGKAKSNTVAFITKANKIHGNFYDYNRTNYESLDKEIVIICPKHGEFKILPRHHIYGTQVGCSICSRSKGEIAIRNWLIENEILFEEQKVLKGLKRKRFDFYLPAYNMCIEFDGAQHFHLRHQRTRNKQKAEQRFDALLKRDKEKTDFCLQNNINLLRVNYLQLKNINKILEHEVFHNSSY